MIVLAFGQLVPLQAGPCLFFLFFLKYLPDHFYVLQLVLQVIIATLIPNQTFTPKFLLFTLGQSHKILLFHLGFLLKFAFNLFVDNVVYALLACVFVVHQVISVLTNQKSFTTLFLYLSSTFDLVLFRENCRYFGSHVLGIFLIQLLLVLLDFKQSLWTWLIC